MEFVEHLPPNIAGRIRKNRRIFAGDFPTLCLIIVAIIAFFALPGWLGINCALTLGSIALILYGFNRNLLGNVILWHFARKRIKGRPDRIVDPNESGVWFVSVIPRRRWKTPTWDKATDVGFLKIDHDHGWLLFEGDQERYRIPAHSIMRVCEENARVRDLEVVPGGFPMDKWLQYYIVAVILRGESQQIEACFLILTGRGLFRSKQQESASLELLKEIQQLQKSSSQVKEM